MVGSEETHDDNRAIVNPWAIEVEPVQRSGICGQIKLTFGRSHEQRPFQDSACGGAAREDVTNLRCGF
jgi:hypothetical protein